MNKQAFAQIVFAQTVNCPFAVTVSFVHEAPHRVMRVRTTANGIRLYVNLRGSGEWQTRFLAYYIAEYIRCLAGAKDMMPTTLFEGLVQLDALTVIDDTAVSPLAKNGTKGLRPLHIHCAKTALAQLDTADTALDAYTAAPEVVYNQKGRAQFAAVWAANILKTAGDILPAALTADILFRAALLCDGAVQPFADSYERFLQQDGGVLRAYSEQNSRLVQDNTRAIVTLLEKARGRTI